MYLFLSGVALDKKGEGWQMSIVYRFYTYLFTENEIGRSFVFSFLSFSIDFLLSS